MIIQQLNRLKHTLRKAVQTHDQKERQAAINNLHDFYHHLNTSGFMSASEKKRCIGFIEAYRDQLPWNQGEPILRACAIACQQIERSHPGSLTDMILFGLNYSAAHVKECIREHREPSNLDNDNFYTMVRILLSHMDISAPRNICNQLVSFRECLRATGRIHAIARKMCLCLSDGIQAGRSDNQSIFAIPGNRHSWATQAGMESARDG